MFRTSGPKATEPIQQEYGGQGRVDHWLPIAKDKKMSDKKYVIAAKSAAPSKGEKWDGPYWKDVQPVSIDKFHSRGTDHKPVVKCKVAHSGEAIHVFFKVDDNYIRSVHTKMQDPVCRDSCVEFFVMPPNPKDAYFNFEVNAGGVLYLSYVEDPTRKDLGPLNKFTFVDEKWLPELRIEHSMPAVVEPEIQTSTTWTIQYSAPVAMFEEYMGKKLGKLGGQAWRANFYKCGDQTSHPHWAMWSDVGDPLSFHKPEKFAEIVFE